MVKKMTISGMMCNHCKMTVEKALNAIDGVIEATVDLEDKSAVIRMDRPVDDGILISAVQEKGFEPQQIAEIQ